MENKKTKEGGVYKMEEKEIKKLNRRNYFNCTSNNNYCFTYFSWCKYCDINRGKWTIRKVNTSSN